MLNGIHLSTTSDPSSSATPRQLLEAVTELLQQKDASISNVQGLVGQLAESLDRYCESRETRALYDDAIVRAPYLTADAERLAQQQSALRQSLQSLRILASRPGVSCESLGRRCEEFTELYLEFEAAEHNFLQTAFPGPDWAA